MPRRKKRVVDFETVNLVDQVVLDPFPQLNVRRTRRRNTIGAERDGQLGEGIELDFHNICPCMSCAEFPRPTVRLMSVIGRHLMTRPIAPKYEVYYIHLVFFPCHLFISFNT